MKTENDYYSAFRPVVDPDLTERIKKLTSNYNLSSQKLVNFFTQIGCECMERSLPLIEESIKERFNSVFTKAISEANKK
ncbi:MAG TPA: hypothetical protein ENO18_04325 [Caldithrix sp.]|nr:hypothetical protein [Caldithrix sp.]